MSEQTNIEWCDVTLNLWTLRNGERHEVKSWRQTLNKISKRAKEETFAYLNHLDAYEEGIHETKPTKPRRLRVFCQSISDTFEGPETMGGDKSDNWKLVSRLQDDLMEVVFAYPELDFLLLTKRPENVLSVVYRHDCPDAPGFNWMWPDNLWLGVSVEDQKTADERIPHLLNIPAKVRFLSCEPLLGPISLTNIYLSGCGGSVTLDALRGVEEWETEDDSGTSYSEQHIDWVICGGELEPNARPMHPVWARSLRDQCQAANVPFFFKQWGEWAPGEIVADFMPINLVGCWVNGDGIPLYERMVFASETMLMDDEPEVYRLGKKRAGRILDGREWNEFPAEVSR